MVGKKFMYAEDWKCFKYLCFMLADSSHRNGLKFPEICDSAFFVEIYDTKYLVLMLENQVQNFL